MTGVEHSAPKTVGWVSVAPPTLEEHSASMAPARALFVRNCLAKFCSARRTGWTDDCSDSEPTGHDSDLPTECSPGMA